jgi:hypothetical protein
MCKNFKDIPKVKHNKTYAYFVMEKSMNIGKIMKLIIGIRHMHATTWHVML